MTAAINAPQPLGAAQVAQLTACHLQLLARMDGLANQLEARMPVPDALAELRSMAASARAAA